MAEILDGFLANYLFAEANATVNFSRNSTRPPPIPFPTTTTHTHTNPTPPALAGWALVVPLVRVIPGALVADASFLRRFFPAADRFHIVSDDGGVNMPSVSAQHCTGLDA